MRITELAYLGSSGLPNQAELSPELDPLRVESILQEATLVGLKQDSIRSQSMMLLDCKGALGVDNAYTAVLLFNGVNELHWDQEPGRVHARQSFSIVGWAVDETNGVLSLVASFEPSAELIITSTQIRFFLGSVPGDDRPSPDFATADEPTMQTGLVGWESDFSLDRFSLRTAQEPDAR